MRLTVQQAFGVLGVSSDATSDQVRQAYRKLALQFHPGKNADPSATETFQRISAAYKCTCDHHSRCAAGTHKMPSFNGFVDSDDEDLLDEEGDNDDMLDEMDLSYEDMLTMFQMMFGGAQAFHRRSKPTKKASAKANAKGPQVRVPRRGGRGNNNRRRVPGRGGFGHSPVFHSAEEMMFESFMAMGMGMDLYVRSHCYDLVLSLDLVLTTELAFIVVVVGCRRDLEKGLVSMSSFSDSSLGEDLNSDVSSVSSDEDEMEHHGMLFQVNDEKNTSMTPRDKSSLAVEAKRAGGNSAAREAVVEFRGPVYYAKGDFIGVCLNEPLGKNDGMIKGVSYFSCPPQCGLMVRSEDVVIVV